MSHGLTNHTSYVSCPDTDLLVQHIVAICEAEGMKRVEKSRAGLLRHLPALECNTWRVVVSKGRSGWHTLDATPWTLFSESPAAKAEPRLQSLCKSLGTQGFALHMSDAGPWGKVLMETDGDQLALSGYWVESEDARAMEYHGIQMSEESEDFELRFQLLKPMQHMLEYGLKECDIYADDDSERACEYFARELGGSTDEPWWEWASCDSVILSFSWPAQDRPEPTPTASEVALHEFLKEDRHFYADGSPILHRDAVLFDGGRLPGRINRLMYNYDAQGSCFPTAVMLESLESSRQVEGKMHEFENGPRFTDLILVERNSADFMQAGLKFLMDKAEQGDAQAQLNLGSLYKMGHGVEQDTAKALDLWRKAASQGLEEAQNKLRAFE